MAELSYKEAQELLTGSGFKALDRNRKAVLSLPSCALHIWLCYWMAEDDHRESWMSHSEIQTQTGLSEKTIIKWTKWLIRHRWLVQTGRTAADKCRELGLPVSVGSHNVEVYYVDDPTSYPSKTLGDTCSIPPKSIPKEVPDKVLLGSGSDFLQLGCIGIDFVELPQNPPPPSTPSGETKTEKPKPTASGVWRKGKRMVASDGTPWPDKHTWDVVMSNKERLDWLEGHDSDSIDYEGQAPQYEAGSSAPNKKAKPKAHDDAPVNGQCDGYDDYCAEDATVMIDNHRYCDRCWSKREEASL